MRFSATVCLYRPRNTATAPSLPEFATVCGRVHAFGRDPQALGPAVQRRNVGGYLFTVAGVPSSFGGMPDLGVQSDPKPRLAEQAILVGSIFGGPPELYRGFLMSGGIFKIRVVPQPVGIVLVSPALAEQHQVGAQQIGQRICDQAGVGIARIEQPHGHPLDDPVRSMISLTSNGPLSALR